MEKRRLGRTNHLSTVVALGGAALAKVDQRGADAAVRLMLDHGVNHVDIAPSYGNTLAERQLSGPLREYRSSVFLACKTQERSREGAAAELQSSLDRLQSDHFDLYQLHAVNDLADLERALASGGAVDALFEARAKGLTLNMGITSHGHQAPDVQMAALKRFPFDTVLLPLNYVLWSNEVYRASFQRLLELTTKLDVGVITIKAVAKRPWAGRERTSATWYEPFTESDEIRDCVRFVLSQPVTTLAAASDSRLWPHILDAAESFVPMTPGESAALLSRASEYETIF